MTDPRRGAGAPLYGRDDEQRSLSEALKHHRWVTLTGPAGVGKTTLASRVQSGSARRRFCDLSDARSLSDAQTALANVIGARLVDVKEPEEADERLCQAMLKAEIDLVVLDNCEHLLEATRSLAETLLGVAGVTLIVTSREEVGSALEHVHAVPQLRHDDAVALLFERAKRVFPELLVDESAKIVAARVVERLDRLPLAIELFASRADLLTLPELERRLVEPLKVLRSVDAAGAPKTGGTGARARHADVGAAIRCSWDLLPEAERQVLRCGAMFRGGASLRFLEAALSHAGYDGDLLDDVVRLRRKYLVYTERKPGVEVRYHLLETVRAFVRAEIDEEGNLPRLALAHGRAMVDDAPSVFAPSADGLRALARETENLSAALRRCASNDPEVAARAGLALHPHLALHGPLHAHLSVLDAGVAAAEASGDARLCRQLRTARGDARRKTGRLHAAAVDLEEAHRHAEHDVDKAEVRSSQAMLHMVEGDLDAAVGAIDDAIALASDGEHDLALGMALQRAAAIHLVRGDYPRVEEVAQRALTALQSSADHRGQTNTLTYQGIARLDRSDRGAARLAFEQARKLYEAADDVWSIPVCDAYLGLIQVDEGHLDDAIRVLELARTGARQAGHVRAEAFVEGVTGIALHLQNHLDEAEASCRRGAALAQQAKDLLGGSIATGHLACVLAAQGDRLDEARHWLALSNDYTRFLPNPSARASLIAIEGMLALAEGDVAAARTFRARVPSEDGIHLRLATRLLDDALAAHGTPQSRFGFALSPSGRRLQLPSGEFADLTRRGPLRKILQRLVALHAMGASISVDGLIEAGWPGENVPFEAGSARVYTAIKSLRRLGFEDLLITRDDGYALSPRCTITVLADDSPDSD